MRGEIEWIPNGSLMIGVESEKEGPKIMFWEYLKKVFTLKDADVSNIFWGSKSRKRLLIVYKNSFCEVLDLNLEYKSGIQDFKEEGDLGVYCSIDNRTALTTNFFKYVVPPPMCSLELKSSSYITSYCLGQSKIKNILIKYCYIIL